MCKGRNFLKDHSCRVNMDVSPRQSGSKCGSDFSIERILSDNTKVREESAEAPSWLCCTRYQPPRIPRSANSNACRARRSGRHARVPFTAAQAAALEAAYARAPYLAPPALRALAAALQLRDDRIKIWFQNRRARERREKCSNITPPQAVTLPRTSMAHGVSSASPWTSHFTGALDPSSMRIIGPTFSDGIEPQDLSNTTVSFLRFKHNDALNLETDATLVKNDRPETPLDIETVDDN